LNIPSLFDNVSEDVMSYVCVLADTCQGTLKESSWLWYNFNWSASLPTFNILWKHENKVFRKKWIDFSSSRHNFTI